MKFKSHPSNAATAMVAISNLPNVYTVCHVLGGLFVGVREAGVQELTYDTMLHMSNDFMTAAATAEDANRIEKLEEMVEEAISEDLHIMQLSGDTAGKDIERFLGAIKSVMAHMDTLHPTLGFGHAAALISPMAWGDICGA
jgi:tetrahydromethanopterin S-methyltransferase subunit G